jgi:hypothetical protein
MVRIEVWKGSEPNKFYIFLVELDKEKRRLATHRQASFKDLETALKDAEKRALEAKVPWGLVDFRGHYYPCPYGWKKAVSLMKWLMREVKPFKVSEYV